MTELETAMTFAAVAGMYGAIAFALTGYLLIKLFRYINKNVIRMY